MTIDKIFKEAKELTVNHKYFKDKGFKLGDIPFDIKISDIELIIPIRFCGSSNEIISYQRISPTGNKRFAKGCPIKSGCYRLGSSSINEDEAIFICEGFATGLSIYLSTGNSVIIAFCASNIVNVLRESSNNFIIATDHDDTGLSNAEELSKKFNLSYTYPSKQGTDFNDLYLSDGKEGVKREIEILKCYTANMAPFKDNVIDIGSSRSSVSNIKSPRPSKDGAYLKDILSNLPPEHHEIYDKWIKIGLALYNEFKGDKKGLELYKSFSSQSSKFSNLECETKWEGFHLLKKPLTLAYIARNSVGNEHDLPDKTEIMSELNNWVYVYSTGLFYNTQDMREITKEHAKEYFINCVTSGSSLSWVLRSPFLKKVYGFGYRPKGEVIYHDEMKRSLVNRWVSPGIEPKKGNVDMFLNHVKYICGEEWEILMDFLAWCVKFPSKKLKYFVLLIGKQGTGKGYFQDLFLKLFHHSNVIALREKDIEEKYTAWVTDKHFVVINELMSNNSNKLSLYNDLKTYITEDWVPVRAMRKNMVSQENCLNFLAFSNYDDAMKLDSDDRRVVIIKCYSSVKSDTYYKELYAWTKDNCAQILEYLSARKTSHMVLGKAPFTNQKRLVIEESCDSSLIKELLIILKKKQRTLFSSGEALNWLEENENFNVKKIHSNISRNFQFLGRVRIPNSRIRLYCLNEKAAKYSNLDMNGLRNLYLDESSKG